MINLVSVLLGGLAVWQIVEIWHHSKISLSWRQKATTTVASACGVKAFFLQMILCPFCLSAWVGAGVAALLVLGTTGSLWWNLPVWAFAASRLANLFNDLGYTRNRVFKHYVEETEAPIVNDSEQT